MSDSGSFSHSSEPKNLTTDNLQGLHVKLLSYLRYWPFFMMSVVICIGCAFLFLKTAKPLYTISAKLLIKDDQSEQMSNDSREASKNSKKVDDEIEIIKSRTLMKQVVNQLQLWVKYESINDLDDNDVYGQTPVRFKLLKGGKDVAWHSIVIQIKDEKSFILKQPHSTSTARYFQNLKSSWGTWTLEPTVNLKNFIGQNLRIDLMDPQTITDSYLSSFNAFLAADQSSIVELRLMEFVPERGLDIVNNLITMYNLASVDYKNKVTENTLHFLDERLATITGELTTVEKHEENYRSNLGLTDISSQSKLYLDNVKQNDSRLGEVDIQLQVIKQIESYVNSPKSSNNPPATVGISDPVLMALLDQLLKLESQRDRLLSNTPEENPIFIPLNRQISSTKSAIQQNVNGIKSTLLATRGQLQRYGSGFESSIKKLPGQERQYISIKRQQSVKEELYMYLLQKREEAALTNASKLIGSRIVDSAHYGAPTTRNAKLTYALALLLGLIVPAGMIFIKDNLNNKINEVRQIEEALYTPVLAELSYQKSNSPVLTLEGPKTMLFEQFRILRTNLKQVTGKTGRGKVTLLTSGMPGEGKSMITRNLAAVMAAAGRKTVMLEFDFRRPAISGAMNLPETVGLSDYLRGECYIEDIVQESHLHPNLFVISMGRKPENPSELLETPALEDLFDWLRCHFDEILIDTPPIKIVTDAMILADYSDVNLYVIRHGYTNKSEFKFIHQLHGNQRLKNLHIVFNGISSRNKGYDGNYNYEYYKNEKPRFGLAIFHKN